MCMRNIQSKNGGINNQVLKKGNKFQMISVTIYISTIRSSLVAGLKFTKYPAKNISKLVGSSIKYKNISST